MFATVPAMSASTNSIRVPASILAIVSLAATVTFGIWGVLSYKATFRGNQLASLALQQAVISNQLTLLSWCEGVTVRQYEDHKGKLK